MKRIDLTQRRGGAEIAKMDDVTGGCGVAADRRGSTSGSVAALRLRMVRIEFNGEGGRRRA